MVQLHRRYRSPGFVSSGIRQRALIGEGTAASEEFMAHDLPQQ
ncbi:MAG: hypothetical protein AAEJ65_09440 [Planctomycetota bacterium]